MAKPSTRRRWEPEEEASIRELVAELGTTRAGEDGGGDSEDPERPPTGSVLKRSAQDPAHKKGVQRILHKKELRGSRIFLLA